MLLLELNASVLLTPTGESDKEEGTVEVTVDVVEKLRHCVFTGAAVEEAIALEGIVFAIFSFEMRNHVTSGLELVLLELAVVFSDPEACSVLPGIPEAL